MRISRSALTVAEPSPLAKAMCWVYGHNDRVRGLVKLERRWCSRCGARMPDAVVEEPKE
jgi:hypothetical protein